MAEHYPLLHQTPETAPHGEYRRSSGNRLKLAVDPGLFEGLPATRVSAFVPRLGIGGISIPPGSLTARDRSPGRTALYACTLRVFVPINRVLDA
jgi:hypothetical protein